MELAQASETWTVGRLLLWTADFLKKKGSESPRLDAEVLLAHVLECERMRLYTHYEEEVREKPRSSYRDLVRRRAEGSPVAYLVGRKEFFSLALEVSSAVLIPRPDTETVVVEFLERAKDRTDVRAVDVGTGSGAIALACARRHKSLRMIATDLSTEALEIARRNAMKHDLSERVEFRQGDLIEPVGDDGPFDAILSNPPYIPTAAIPTLEPGVRDYEPHLALDGGHDGLRVVARLIQQALPLLKPGGSLILEIGTAQEAAVRAMLEERPEWELAPTIRDAANHPRVVRATRRG
jgi:release factor glutamine methyltransferase